MNLDINENVITIYLNETFYPYEIVQDSANDFKNVFNCEIKNKDNKLELKITFNEDIKRDERIKIIYEFMNYMLAKIKGGD